MKSKILIILSVLTIHLFLPQYLNAATQKSVIELQSLIHKSKSKIKILRLNLRRGNVTDNELSMYRYRLKAISKDLEQHSVYFQSEIIKKERILEDLNKIGLKNIEESKESFADKNFIESIKKIRKQITFNRILLIESKLVINTIDEMVTDISNRQIELRNKDLFVYNLPFYRGGAWLAGYKDIIKLSSEKHGDLRKFLSTIDK